MNIFRVFTTILYPFFIYLLLFSRKNLLESSGSPPNPSSNSKTGVDLSLKANASTDQFDYNKSGKIVTFTAKDNHGFKSVKTGDKLVWETTNTNEYSNKVVLDGKGKKNKNVTIHMPNNTTKVLKREGKNKPWKDVAQPGTPAGGSGTGPTSGVSGGHGAGQGGHGMASVGSDQDGSGSYGGGTGSGSDGSTHTGGLGGSDPTGGSGTHTSGSGAGSTPTATTGRTGGSSGSGLDGSGTPTGGSGTGPTSGEAGGAGSTPTSTTGRSGGNEGSGTGTGGSGGGSTGTSGGGGNDRNTEVTSQELTPDQYPKEIKLFKADPNDATKTVELDTSEYKVTKTSFHTYKFNDGVKCTLVQHENKDVWKFDSTGTGGSGGEGSGGSTPPSSGGSGTGTKHPLSIELKNTIVIIEFDNNYEFYQKQGDKWSRYHQLDKKPKSSGGGGGTATRGGSTHTAAEGGGNQGSGTGTGGGTTTTTPTSGGGGTTTN